VDIVDEVIDSLVLMSIKKKIMAESEINTAEGNLAANSMLLVKSLVNEIE
jgi:hypothetical protein